ncbi:hypothetical protein [Prauserella alba]|uniref:Excreted virulence factor EspC, type VII ESX diderm n=1 Tax=Prauserella alba TaxID=176898 RepID=A0ABN1VIX1_9PSEU|nr:hypothetical protein [Prauserella alba]MCP2182026.1 hypothetical protein [Prauserella alba]
MPGDGYDVDPLQLRDYADYVSKLSMSVTTIQYSAMYEGMNPEGFTGLLTPIGTACEQVRERILTSVFSMLQAKLNETGEGVRVAAKKYGLAEAETQEQVERAEDTGGHRVV